MIYNLTYLNQWQSRGGGRQGFPLCSLQIILCIYKPHHIRKYLTILKLIRNQTTRALESAQSLLTFPFHTVWVALTSSSSYGAY